VAVPGRRRLAYALPPGKSDHCVDNFESLELAWEWNAASFGGGASVMRATPSYVNGMLYTVAGNRRHVIAIDPDTGETVWSFREPDTWRWEYSMRAGYGKGVAYARSTGARSST
jgi:outer membrane protein assembly factor BamB